MSIDKFDAWFERGMEISGGNISAGQDFVAGDKINAPMVIKDSVVNLTAPAQNVAPPVIAFRVLTIAARPLNVPELPDIADVAALVNGLQQVDAPVFIRFLQPPTVEQLRAALADNWDVIHFDGHGAATDEGGVLAFEKEDGTVQEFSAREFAEMLAQCQHPPALVILSACESASGDGDGLAGVVARAGVRRTSARAVIGTRESVTVDWTMALMRPLYAALGRGYTIREAFEHARPALRSVRNPISETPAHELAALIGDGGNARLCDGAARGEAVMEYARLIGWVAPFQGRFVGDYVEGATPQGRKGLITQTLRALLKDRKLVSLTGTGGIGKSTLAAMVAQRIAWRFPGGVFWIDGRDYLATGMPLDAVLDAFAHVYGEELLKQSTARKRELVLNYMSDVRRSCLIVVDNADVATREVMRFVSELPTRSAALLTTREAPEARGTVITLQAMSQHESLRFLVSAIGERTDDAFWHGEIGEEEKGQLVEMARLLDGHPLALLQAASLVVSEGLRRAFDIVRKHPAQGKELNERFDFSYIPLSDAQKKLLHRLAAFAVDFDEMTLVNVCTNENFVEGDARLDEWETDLRVLRNKSLVEQFDFSEDYRRFRLHPVMRDYVRVKAGNAMRMEDSHVARFFVALVGSLRNRINSTETALVALGIADLERLNLLGTQEMLFESGEWDEVISIAYRMGDLLDRTGRWAEWRRVLELGVKAAKEVAKKNESAEFTHNLGSISSRIGDYGDAEMRYMEALRLKRERGDQVGVAKVLHELGVLAYSTENYSEARRLFDESLTINRELGEQESAALNLWGLALIATHQGDLREAREIYVEVLDTFEKLNSKKNVAGVIHQMGMLAMATGDNAEARRLHDKSLMMRRTLGDREGVALSTGQLGRLAVLEKDFVTAVQLWAEALHTFEELQSPYKDTALGWFGRLREELGEERFGEVLKEAGLG